MSTIEEQEVSRILNCLSGIAAFTTTTSKAIAKRLLEFEFVFCYGDIRDIKVKALGLGVYKIYSTKRTYP